MAGTISSKNAGRRRSQTKQELETSTHAFAADMSHLRFLADSSTALSTFPVIKLFQYFLRNTL